ncbi:MAG: hypothetical protein NVSMB9_11590 [Isosphaeraceae bacterium]
MKRLRPIVALLFLGPVIAGCGGGGPEIGAPAGPVQGAQTSEFKAAMEKAGTKMLTRKKPAAPKTEEK